MNKKERDMLGALSSIFFISGFSALIYQVSWHRLLFTGFGVDLTSTTIIVSIFMAGLGIGAFMGGRIADAAPTKTLKIFCTIEFLIGVFGLASYKLIALLQSYLIDSSLWLSSAAIFGLLLIPTFLMGTTLPLLTMHFNKYLKNIGDSIGRLYFFNTLGASVGAMATGFILFKALGLSQTIYVAAALNIFISILLLVAYKEKNK